MGASAPSRISAADATAGKQVKLELGVLLGNTEYQVYTRYKPRPVGFQIYQSSLRC